MPSCTVLRTHERGRQRDFRQPDIVPGPVVFDSIYVADLNRYVECLRVPRGKYRDGRQRPDALPPLFEPQIRTMSTEQAMMISGFEQIDGQRYYQGWYIRWIEEKVPQNQTGAEQSRA